MSTKPTLLLICALLATGCSTTAEVMMRGQTDMNSGGNAAVVQVYELSGKGSFMDISPQTFWKGNGALSGVLVGSPHRNTLFPNETKTFELELADKTKFIGVAANLRDPDSEEWRALYPVKEVGDQLSVTVHSNRISVTVEGPGVLQRIGI